MLERVLLAAYDYENHLPRVKQRETTGWWPIYDKDYPDEPVEPHGSLEAFNFLMGLSLSPHKRLVLKAFYATGEKVSEREAKRVYAKASYGEVKNILSEIESQYSHEVKKLALLFTTY